MGNNTYIIKFENEISRNEFFEKLKSKTEIKDKKVEIGSFLPDLIIYDVSDEELRELNRIAENKAQFFPDFQSDLFESD